MRVFVSRRQRNSAIAWGVVLLAALVLATVAVDRYVPELTDPAAVRAFVARYGPWAPAVFVLVVAAQVVLAPIPGQGLGFAAGYLFGALPGTVYSVAGAALGSAVAFGLARRYGRSYVERAVAPETLSRFDAFAETNAVRGLFVAFLVPGIPDDVLCFVGGLTDVPVRRLVLVAVVGRTPGFLLAALAGDGLTTGSYWVTAGVLGLLAVLSLAGFLLGDRLVERLS